MTHTATGAPARPFFGDLLAFHGDAPALITKDGVLGYDDLDRRVSGLADELGDERRLVGLAVDTTVESVVAYLAALRGRHPVALVRAGDQHAIDALVHTYDPDVLIAGDIIRERRRGTRHALHPDLALLLSTSGSTGTPKLVRLSRDNLASNAAAIAHYLSLDGTDRAITTLALQYCFGLSVLNSHLHVGAGVVLNGSSVVDPCFWDLFQTTAPTSLAGVPHTFDLLDRVGFEQMHLPSLRSVTQAGGRMRPETVRRYAELGVQRGWDLYVMYGQTEATARMAYLPPHLARSHPGSVGVAIPGGALTIDRPDDDGVGELVYRGPNVMLGYAECTDDLAAGATLDELRTGDRARITPDGLVEIVGRRSRMVKPFGVRVDLDDLERALSRAGLDGWCTGDDHTLTTAVTSPGDADPARQLIAARLRLPTSRVRVLVLDDVPRLPTGKVDHRALHELAAAPPPVVNARDEGAVRATFARVLGVEPSEDDTFVSLGGDSLSYVEMSIALEEILGTLPRSWHTTPIARLRRSTGRRRPWAPVETTVIVRAVAIVLIVANHSGLWEHPGGAHALLAVAGFNFARFQLTDRPRWTSIARVVAPSVAWLALLAFTTDDFAWPHALLVNGLFGGPDARWAYWFVEALVWILVPLVALLALPAVRAAERRRPFPVAAAAVGVGLVVRFDVIVDLSLDHRTSRPHEVLWLFALGWASAVASTRWHRVAVTAVTLCAMPGYFDDPHRELIVTVAILLVVWVPTLPVPRPATALVATLAASSLYVYLTHFQVYPSIDSVVGPAGACLASLIVGIVVSGAAERANRRISSGVLRPADATP